ncbi:hypothetical protein Goari_022385 [Gossypium aridum]|uniref:Myb/SANT-like domain-containing protein n=1 Tax=Gossypium aridum TaxID=34290 RepID=A0A7J8YQW9_GOSAI|nr:hypothetical protein [Gossypium aridum]
MVAKLLPHTKLKAKPNLESRIRTLKNDWEIIYDMLSGKDGSAFGWDEHKQMVVVEDVVRDFIYKYNMDISATQSQPSNPNIVDSIFSKKIRKSSKVSKPNSSNSLIDAATLLGDNIRQVGFELSRSIGFEMLIQEKVQKLYVALGEREGLIEDE